MYRGGSDLKIFKDCSVVQSSLKQPNTGDIVVTTLDMNLGKVTWKIQGGQDIGEATHEGLKSGLWYFAVSLYNSDKYIELIECPYLNQ